MGFKEISKKLFKMYAVYLQKEAAVNGSLVYVLGSQVQSIIRPVKEKI